MNEMTCMKCGSKVALGQVFCKDCLEDMSHYPVNPATPVQIPVQPPAVHTNRRNARSKKVKKPEEQVIRLRKLVRLQFIAILCLVAIICGLGYLGYKKLRTPNETHRPGENYVSTDTTKKNGPVAP